MTTDRSFWKGFCKVLTACSVKAFASLIAVIIFSFLLVITLYNTWRYPYKDVLNDLLELFNSLRQL